MTLPPNSILASGPVIIEEVDGKLCTLLNKKKPTPENPSPQWQFCGGKWKKSDNSLEETAKREAKEEMGIGITIKKLIDVLLIKKGGGAVIILVHYLAKRTGKISPGVGIEKWNWFPLDELPKNCAPNVRQVIEKIKLDI